MGSDGIEHFRPPISRRRRLWWRRCARHALWIRSYEAPPASRPRRLRQLYIQRPPEESRCLRSRTPATPAQTPSSTLERTWTRRVGGIDWGWLSLPVRTPATTSRSLLAQGMADLTGDYYYGKVGFGPVQGSAQPFRGEQAE